MEYKELDKNKLVVFDDNGKTIKVDRLGVCWSEKHQAWRTPSERFDESGCRIILYSTTVIDKPVRKSTKKPFVPSKETCTVWITPCGSTEKAYQIEAGWNGMWGRGRKEYYKYVAKSVCWIDEEGRIFAPAWAVR